MNNKQQITEIVVPKSAIGETIDPEATGEFANLDAFDELKQICKLRKPVALVNANGRTSRFKVDTFETSRVYRSSDLNTIPEIRLKV